MAAKSKSHKGSLDYWASQGYYGTLVNLATGIGIGLLAQPMLADSGYVTVLGWVLVLLGVLSHLYSFVA